MRESNDAAAVAGGRRRVKGFMAKTKEQIYNEEIAPLLKKVFAICTKHKLPLFLVLPVDVDSGLTAVMALLDEEYNPPPALVMIFNLMMESIESVDQIATTEQ